MDLDPIRAALAARPPHEEPPGKRAASVAMILVQGDVLFIRRAEHPGSPWSGHIGFPGGHAEPDDADLLATARRETLEEIGLDLPHEALLGRLGDLRARPNPDLVIRPWVFAVSELPSLTPSHEVASVHRLGLDALLKGEGRGEMQLDWRGYAVTLPRVDFEGLRLWGLTLRIVDDLLDRLDGLGVDLSRPRR